MQNASNESHQMDITKSRLNSQFNSLQRQIKEHFNMLFR